MKKSYYFKIEGKVDLMRSTATDKAQAERSAVKLWMNNGTVVTDIIEVSEPEFNVLATYNAAL